jgi:hypothetical protein
MRHAHATTMSNTTHRSSFLLLLRSRGLALSSAMWYLSSA